MIGATSRSLAELMQEQIIYILENDVQEQNIKIYNALLEETNDLLEILENNTNIANDSLIMHVPYVYWKDNYDFNFENSFKENNKDLLIIQGEKDYQVPLKDFYTWKKWAKKHNKNQVSLEIIPKMNHILNESENEKSSPNEYVQAASFSSNLIEVITQWVFQ